MVKSSASPIQHSFQSDEKTTSVVSLLVPVLKFVGTCVVVTNLAPSKVPPPPVGSNLSSPASAR